MKEDATNSMNVCNFDLATVSLRWSEVLESAFDYYHEEYITAWTLSQTPFNNSGEKVFIWKKNNEWVSWEKIDITKRPDIATLFDILPDLPRDDEYRLILIELKNRGIKDAEDYFWENIFSYKKAKEFKVNGRRYRIEWEA